MAAHQRWRAWPLSGVLDGRKGTRLLPGHPVLNPQPERRIGAAFSVPMFLQRSHIQSYAGVGQSTQPANRRSAEIDRSLGQGSEA